jgi:hypothetical protein
MSSISIAFAVWSNMLSAAGGIIRSVPAGERGTIDPTRLFHRFVDLRKPHVLVAHFYGALVAIACIVRDLSGSLAWFWLTEQLAGSASVL